MKKTKKALLSMLLSAAMVIAMLPGMSMVAKAGEPQDDSQVYSIEPDCCTVDIADKNIDINEVPVKTVVTITFAPDIEGDSFGQWSIRKNDVSETDVTDELLGNNNFKVNYIY